LNPESIVGALIRRAFLGQRVEYFGNESTFGERVKYVFDILDVIPPDFADAA
jgi:hypothetical protein